MSEIRRHEVIPAAGFYPVAGMLGGRNPNTIIDGRNVLFVDSSFPRSAKGLGAAPPSAVGGARLYNVNDKVGAVRGKGSVLPFLSGSFMYLSVESGAGIILVGGLNINGTGGKLRYNFGGVEYEAGLSAPTAPTLDVGAAGTMNGLYSAELTRIRTNAFLDGGTAQSIVAQSNPSPPGKKMDGTFPALENKRIKVIFPAAGTGVNKHDAWGLYFTIADEASFGTFRFYKIIKETDIAAAPGRALEFNFSDNELLSEFPPTSNFPPPPGEFVVNVGNVTAILNAYGGNGQVGVYIAPSKQGEFEHYNPLGVFSLSPPEAVNGFIPRGANGGVVCWGNNSVQELLLTGDDTSPLFARPMWPQDGIMAAHGGAFDKDTFYAYTNQPARYNGTEGPDTSFGQPVRDYMKDTQPDPSKWVVGYDPILDAVVYMTGNLAFAYMVGLSKLEGRPIWSLPVNIMTATETMVKSALTFNGKLLVGRDNVTYSWEDGIANPAWYMVQARQDFPASMNLKTITGFRFHAKMSNLVARLFLDGADYNNLSAAHSGAGGTLMDTGSGIHYSKWSKTNVCCKDYTLRIDGSAQGDIVDATQYEIYYTPDLRDAA